MNDDFLYRLRTEPPPQFAEALKARLDRRAKRIVRPWHFAFGALLFGAAFATMSYWHREAPTPDVPPPGLARVFEEKKIEPPTTRAEPPPAPAVPANDALKASVRALLEEEQAKRQLPVTLAPPPAQTESPADTTTDIDEEDAQSSFIVTGPLPGDYETRRAYFTVMEWTIKPLQNMVTKRAPTDFKIARTAAARLAMLTTMMPEMFAKDERGSGVRTRTRDIVWEQRESFIRESYDFSKAVQALLVATKSDDEQLLRRATTQVFKGCSSCHDKFREGGSKDVGAVTP